VGVESKKKVRLAVLLSGGGSTMANLAERSRDGRLDAEVAVVVSSRADAYGRERARRLGIEEHLVSSHKVDFDQLSLSTFEVIRPYRPDLIILAGYMCLFRVPRGYENRVMNVHPALIPMFCGKGLYGHRVHEAVVRAGLKVSGCTVHFVDNEYDHGPIILQKTVPVYFEDTPDTLAERVQAAEREAYPEAINLYAAGRLQVIEGRVKILGGEPPPTVS